MLKSLTYFHAVMSASTLFCIMSQILILTSWKGFFFFFCKNLTSSHHLMGYFSKFSSGGTCPETPLVLLRLPTQSTTTKQSKRNTVFFWTCGAKYSFLSWSWQRDKRSKERHSGAVYFPAFLSFANHKQICQVSDMCPPPNVKLIPTPLATDIAIILPK